MCVDQATGCSFPFFLIWKAWNMYKAIHVYMYVHLTSGPLVPAKTYNAQIWTCQLPVPATGSHVRYSVPNGVVSTSREAHDTICDQQRRFALIRSPQHAQYLGLYV